MSDFPVLSQRRPPVALIAIGASQLALTIAVSHNLHRAVRPGALLLLFAGALAVFGLEILQRRLCDGVGLSRAALVRETLFRHLMKVEPAVISRRRHGAMLQSFVGDLTALRQWVSDGQLRGFLAFLALAGILGWLGFSAPLLAGPFAAIVGIAIIIGALLLPSLDTAVRTVRRERGRVSAFASERLATQATIQAFGRGANESVKLSRRVDRMNRAALRRSWLTGSLRALPHLATTVMFLVVVAMRIPGPGGIAGSMLIVGVLGLSLRDLARAGELMIPGRIAIGRLERLLSLPAATSPRKRSKRARSETGLVIEALRLSPAAPKINATVTPGEVILLDGDPAWRNHLFASLAGIRRAAGGDIRWNGRSLVGASRAARRALVGLSSPNLPLVPGSAAMNVRYRASRTPRDDIEQLANSWGINPAGRSEDKGRVMLLRALAGNPPILLLDLPHGSLGPPYVALLRNVVRNWPGAVIVAGVEEGDIGTPVRRWKFAPDGKLFADEAAVRLIGKGQR